LKEFGCKTYEQKLLEAKNISDGSNFSFIDRLCILTYTVIYFAASLSQEKIISFVYSKLLQNSIKVLGDFTNSQRK